MISLYSCCNLLTVQTHHPGITETGDILCHEDAVRCLVPSSHRKWIVTSSCDATTIVWDTQRRTVLQEWITYQSPVHALTLSPDSQRLASAGSTGGQETLVVWDITNNTPEAFSLEGNSGPCTSCAWSLDGTLISSASNDGTVHIWEGHTFRQRDLLRHVQSPSTHTTSILSRWMLGCLSTCIRLLFLDAQRRKIAERSSVARQSRKRPRQHTMIRPQAGEQMRCDWSCGLVHSPRRTPCGADMGGLGERLQTDHPGKALQLVACRTRIILTRRHIPFLHIGSKFCEDLEHQIWGTEALVRDLREGALCGSFFSRWRVHHYRVTEECCATLGNPRRLVRHSTS